MKHLSKTMLGVLLALTLLLSAALPAAAQEPVKATAVSDQELHDALFGALEWAKLGEDTLLNDAFLETAGIGGEWLVLAASRAGLKEDYSKYLTTLTAYVQQKYRENGSASAFRSTTDWHRITFGVLACGGDPTHVGEDQNGNPINLIADGVYNRKDENGQGVLPNQGVNALIYGLIALDTMRYEVPADALYDRDDLIQGILENQTTSGGFAWFGDSSDPDMTGMAIQALAPYYASGKVYSYTSAVQKNPDGTPAACQKTVRQVVDEAIESLVPQQLATGDLYSPWSVGPEATVQLVIGLCALGIDPAQDSRFVTEDGKTLIDGILRHRNEDGSFGSGAMATEQVAYTLAAYTRLRANQRDLFDFRAETDATRFAFEANGETIEIPVTAGQTEYALTLPAGTASVKVANLPMGPYDTADVAVGQELAVGDGGKLTVTVTGRTGAVTEYLLTVSLRAAGSDNEPSPPTGVPAAASAVVLLGLSAAAVIALRRKANA